MNSKERLNFIQFPSPVGSIFICASPEGICHLRFHGNETPSKADLIRSISNGYPQCEVDFDAHLSLLQDTKNAILCYFHQHIPIENIPLDIRVGSAFQQEVWRALYTIPFGETRSYQQIAKNIGRPKASRAVGQACGRNPVAVIIPCHRVLAHGGKIGGFSSGLHIKRVLLEIEGIRFSPTH